MAQLKGKFIIELDKPPKLLFISKDGLGSNDELYVNGEKVTGETDITIHSSMDSFTEHEIRYITSHVK